eukprot:3769130-Rhodomonas_salina.1
MTSSWCLLVKFLSCRTGVSHSKWPKPEQGWQSAGTASGRSQWVWVGPRETAPLCLCALKRPYTNSRAHGPT